VQRYHGRVGGNLAGCVARRASSRDYAPRASTLTTRRTPLTGEDDVAARPKRSEARPLHLHLFVDPSGRVPIYSRLLRRFLSLWSARSSITRAPRARSLRSLPPRKINDILSARAIPRPGREASNLAGHFIGIRLDGKVGREMGLSFITPETLILLSGTYTPHARISAQGRRRLPSGERVRRAGQEGETEKGEREGGRASPRSKYCNIWRDSYEFESRLRPSTFHFTS